MGNNNCFTKPSLKSNALNCSALDEILKPTELVNCESEQDFKNQLSKLNPNQEIQQREIQFTSQFQLIEKEKPTEAQIKSLQQQHRKHENNLFQQIEQKKGQQTIEGVLLLHQMLKQDGIDTYISNKPFLQLQQSPRAALQQKIIQCGMQDSSAYFSANYDSPLQMNRQIRQASTLENYIQNFKLEIVKKLDNKNVAPQNILIISASSSPPSIDFLINSISQKNINIKSKDFTSLGFNLETRNLLQNAELSTYMFNQKYNMSWEQCKEKYTYRGALYIKNQENFFAQGYKFPFGYQGLGLTVLNQYGNDKNWIRADIKPDTWIVLFHGRGYLNIKGIIDKNKNNSGIHNAFINDICRITGDTIKAGENANTFLADNVKEAETQSLQINLKNGRSFSLVFQCRVDPKKVKSPEDHPTYYTVENPFDEIRPYRLLIKEIVK